MERGAGLAAIALIVVEAERAFDDGWATHTLDEVEPTDEVRPLWGS